MKKEFKVDFNDYVYSVKETAILLKTDEPTVRELIRKKILKALKLRSTKVRREEIVRFLSWAEGKDLSDLDNIKNF